jgi:hypothetical protein
MKSSLHNNDHLTRAQLDDFLRGKSDAQMDKLLADCELSREAVEGFSAMPAALADLPSLDRQIAARSGMNTPSWVKIFSGVAAVTAIGAVTFFLLPSSEKQVTELPKVAPAPTVAPVQGTPPVVELTPQSEHFVNPEARSPRAAKPKSDAPVDSSARRPLEKGQPIQAIAPPEIIVEKPVVPEKPEAGYNASVGFILDLKVTEFDKYYRGSTVTVRELALPGVPAEFSDDNDRRASSDDRETVRQVPAENFLTEGLQSFRDGRFGRCIEKMEALEKNNSGDLNALFYMGVSYVKLEMYGKAIPLLNRVLEAHNNVFHEEARWYKAQALIGSGDAEAAKKVLEEIAAKEGFYQQKAKELLKSL